MVTRVTTKPNSLEIIIGVFAVMVAFAALDAFIFNAADIVITVDAALVAFVCDAADIVITVDAALVAFAYEAADIVMIAISA